MNAKDALNSAADLSLFVVTKYIDDLSDAELMTRPAPGCNHPAWQLGHVISSNAKLLDAICPGQAAPLPEGFVEHHAKENSASDDASQFCTRDQYLELLTSMRRATRDALAALPDEALAKPSPEWLQRRFPRVLDVFTLIGAHPLMHAGQFVPIRRAAGKPVVI